MGQRAKSQVEIKDFPGLVLNADPHDLPPGAAADQVNAQSDVPGELTTRRGLRVVSFETVSVV